MNGWNEAVCRIANWRVAAMKACRCLRCWRLYWMSRARCSSDILRVGGELGTVPSPSGGEEDGDAGEASGSSHSGIRAFGAPMSVSEGGGQT